MIQTEVIIVGGGINGCGLLRDLSLNGVHTLLIEKGDFSSQTSQSSSKMLHGGIRYLEHFDFSLVQEALEEKNLWLKQTPHLCYENEFYLPLYDTSKHSPLMIKAGLFLYDLLSHFQNKPHKFLGRDKVIEDLGPIKKDGLLAAGVYYDGIVDDAKLSLECLYDGLLEPHSQALSYHEVVKAERKAEGYEVSFLDLRSRKILKAQGKFLVFTTGPFTDGLLQDLGLSWKPQLVPSKGVHLWLKKDALPLSQGVVLTTKDDRVIFVIPQRNAILVGTTETPLKEDPYNIRAHHEEIQYLLNHLIEFFPFLKLQSDSIISSFAGVRPLVREESGTDLGKVSRHHKIFRPDSRCYVLAGGKYTTFRKMCQDLAQEITPRLGKVYNPNLTLLPLRQKSLVNTFSDQEISIELIKRIIKEERVTYLEDLLHRRLSLLNETSHIKQVGEVSIEEILEQTGLKPI